MFRVEEKSIIYVDTQKDTTITIEEKFYHFLKEFILEGKRNIVIEELNKVGLEEILIKNKNKLLEYMEESLKIKSPKNSFVTPMIMNIELTTKCPLRCPQCYCHLDEGEHIPKDVAIKYIREAGKLKIPSINLSGGETLEYPYIFELVNECRKNNIFSSVALSGYKFNIKVLDSFIKNGVGGIYISLNGSTKEINSKTRDGYELAINALKILSESNFENYYINWVAHNCNIDDFKNVIELGKKYGVKRICVLSFKPDADYKLDGAPEEAKFIQLGNYIKGFKDDDISIEVEPCYSELKAYISQNFFFNSNTGKQRGCGAGRDGISITVEGEITPCRHIEYSEEFSTIEEYWNKSLYLEKLRNYDENIKEPCSKCKYSNYCNHCAAINIKINKEMYKGNKYCPLGNN